MLVYAGIDEAGYGPMFGPLVIARTVFLFDKRDSLDPLPSLWQVLRGAVCRQPGDSRGRIAVNDSKRLYSPAVGLGHLERGVLSFLHFLDCAPNCLETLLARLGFDEDSRSFEHPCYVGQEDPLIPVRLSVGELGDSIDRLSGAGKRTGTRLVDAKAAVVLEDRFNTLVASSGNKALCAWKFVGGHLRDIWEDFGAYRPQVVIDRQGGRIYYLKLLSALFPGARLCVHEETPAMSRYEIIDGDHSMIVTVQIGAEERHLPAALAAMTAKYIRELLMLRFRAFWRLHAPNVRPTYGYYGDGGRFLREIETLIPSLRLDPRQIVRCC